ncbi:MAG: PAS domain S-box protein [Spirochaetes bacterium]|nr:MAG: PAS domain S-box protein [Spirochaetota bacterium]
MRNGNDSDMREKSALRGDPCASPHRQGPGIPGALAGAALCALAIVLLVELLEFILAPGLPAPYRLLLGAAAGTAAGLVSAWYVVFRMLKDYRRNLDGIIGRLRTEEELQRSEERLGTLIRNINEYVYSVYFTGGTLSSAFHSPQSEKVTGYTPAEYEADPDLWHRMLYPADRERVLAFFGNVRANLNPDPIEHRIVHKNGETRWISNTASVILDEWGEVARLDGFVLDITSRKQAEEELHGYRDRLEELVCARTGELEAANTSLQREIAGRRLYEEKLKRSEIKNRTILESSTDAVFLESLDGRILDCNQSACDQFGYTREELHGITVMDLLPGDAGMIHPDAVRDRLAGDGIFIETRNMRKDGSVFPCEVRARLVVIQDEELVVVFVHDLTAARRAEEEIRSLNENLTGAVAKLEEANRELEAFNYTVSHDLRLPLLTIGGYANLVARHFGGLIPDEAHRYLKIIGDEVRRMENLLSDLLELSRLENHQFDLKPIDIAAMSTRIFSLLGPREDDRQPSLQAGTLPPCFGDEVMIEQLLKNLIGNSLKYSSRQRHPKIEMGGWNQGIENTYFVKDNGIGFDMKDADKLFEIFERLHPQEEFPGTGVGLTIVQRIVCRHGGRVWAESRPGKGATFFFTLPAVQVDVNPRQNTKALATD